MEVSEGDHEDVWVLMKVGADGVPQVAPGYEHFQPQSGQMYNCSEVGEGLYNCTVVDGPIHSTSNCSIVTSDISEIQKCIEAGGATKPVKLPGEPVEPQPPAPTVSVVSEVPDKTTTIPPSPSTEETDTITKETDTITEKPDTTAKPLDKLNYKEVCGRTPWLNETFRNSEASPRSGRKIGEKDQFWRQFFRQPRIVNGRYDPSQYLVWC